MYWASHAYYRSQSEDHEMFELKDRYSHNRSIMFVRRGAKTSVLGCAGAWVFDYFLTPYPNGSVNPRVLMDEVIVKPVKKVGLYDPEATRQALKQLLPDLDADSTELAKKLMDKVNNHGAYKNHIMRRKLYDDYGDEVEIPECHKPCDELCLVISAYEEMCRREADIDKGRAEWRGIHD